MATSNMPDLRSRLTLDISDFTRGLAEARGQASLFSREIENVGSHFKTAGVAMATFATVSLFTAGIVATSFMASIGVLMTLGAVSAMQAESVQAAWSKTGEHLRKGMLDAARAYVPVLERLASGVRTLFDTVKPALTQVFDRLAPLFEDLSNSFMGWLQGLIQQLPSMVNSAIAFLFQIGPAWDQATDNMRAGWNRVYEAVLSFGPALMQNGLPPFGEFVGNVLALLEPIIQASASFAGPIFSALSQAMIVLRGVLSEVLGQTTDELVGVANTIGTLANSLGTMLSGIGTPIESLLGTLISFGQIAAGAFAGLQPTLVGLVQAAANTAHELLPVLSAVGAFVVELGPAAVAFAQMITAMVRGFVTGIQPVLDAMGLNWADDLASGIQAITPAMAALAEMTGRFVTFLFQGIGLITNLGSMIMGGLGDITGMFGNMGENAGRALVVGIIAGLGFMISPLVGVVAGMIAAVASFMPASPAEVGPLSGAGSPDQRGFTVGSMFADGIAASTDLVRAAAGQLAGAVVLPTQATDIGAPGMGNPLAALASAAGAVTNVIVNVAGSVIAEKELTGLVQNAALRKEQRNAGSILATEVRT